MLALLLLVAAFVVLVLAAVGVPAGRVSLLAAGIALEVAAHLAQIWP